MKKFLKITFFAVLSVVLLFSCASPEPIIKLKLKEENTRWNNGQEYYIFNEDGVKAAVSFYRNTAEHLILNVMIENRSDGTFLVDPTNFAFEIASNSDDVKDYKQYAINPESMIFDIDKRQSIMAADQKNALVADIVVEAVDVTATAVAAANDDDGDSDIIVHNYIHRANDRMIDREIREQDFEFNSNNLEDARFVWENHTIRKTHLEPGFYIDGKVYFKRNDQAKDMTLILPLGNKIIQIDFEQVIYWL
jgi:hypothetical protein